MKQIQLSKQRFKDILAVTSHVAHANPDRPTLEYIQLEVKEHEIVATALDGYQAGRIRFFYIEALIPFTCWFKPFPLKGVQDIDLITVAYDDVDKVTIITIPTENYGDEICYKFKTPDKPFPNIDKTFSDAQAHDIRTGVDPKRLISALKALSSHGSEYGRPMVYLDTKQSGVAPFIIRRKLDGDLEDEQLVLPMRD